MKLIKLKQEIQNLLKWTPDFPLEDLYIKYNTNSEKIIQKIYRETIKKQTINNKKRDKDLKLQFKQQINKKLINNKKEEIKK